MIHTREQLVTLLVARLRSAGRRSVVRAIEEGSFEVLGGFDPIPSSTNSGWIVKVTSKHGKVWYVACVAYSGTMYSVRLVKHVLWENWVGEGVGRSLLGGDRPTTYAAFKRKGKHEGDEVASGERRSPA